MLAKPFRNGLLIAAALFGLTACGFQLRGDYHVASALAEVYLQAPERSDIQRQVQQTLHQRGIAIVTDPQQVVQIHVHEDRLERRILSMLSSGQVAEYELIYSLPITISYGANHTSQHTIQILRDYQDDPNFALAKTRELELVLAEMRAEAANRLMLLLNQFAVDVTGTP